MSIVFIVIGVFATLFIALMALALFAIKPDHYTETEEQFNRDEKSKSTVDKDGIAWGDVWP
jgi:hypothetical protein